MNEDSDDIKNNNLAFLEEYAPELHGRLLAHQENAEGINLVQEPEHRGTVRFTIPPPNAATVDSYTFNFMESLLNEAREQNIPMIDLPVASNSYYLIVLGVTHHIPLYRLINSTQCRALLLIEPDMNALWWSLDYVNWRALAEELEKRNGTIDFVFFDNAEQISGHIWRTIRLMNPVCSDGATFAAYGHTDLANEISDKLRFEISLSYSSLGFFYDESLMVWNTYNNLTKHDAHLFQRDINRHLNCPVFLVASGPSLDQTIETIKAHAANAVIISCGSALRPLIVNGIVPDFQIETENIEVSPLTQQLAREHDLSGVTLVCSTTLDPEVFSAFKRIIFFFRAPLSAYPLFSPSEESSLLVPDPTVGNAALSFALELGFTDVFMFGYDCGSKDAEQHHSKDAYHYTKDAGNVDIQYHIPVDANFDGDVWTNAGLYASITNLSELIGAFGHRDRNVFNCSDGALIKGAEPLLASDISLPTKQRSKHDTVTKIIADLPNFLGKDQKYAWMGSAFRDTIRGYGDLVRERIRDIEDFSDKSYQQALMDLFQPQIGPFLVPPKGVNHCVNIMLRGTLFAMLLFIERYLARVAYPDDVNRFGKIAMAQFDQALEIIERDAIERFGGDMPKAPPPVDTIYRAKGTPLPALLEPPRNAPCPCGSQKKFKHCHGQST